MQGTQLSQLQLVDTVLATPCTGRKVQRPTATMSANKRVALLGIFHETNTFSHIKADYAAFDGSSAVAPGGKITRRQEILDEYVQSNHVVAGYYEVSQQLGFDLVPLMHCTTGPIGTITADAYDRLSGEMLGMLWAHTPLAMHRI
eukprot:SAG11_NODE_390_length_9860_cov_49.246184_6_plen_145_part_00